MCILFWIMKIRIRDHENWLIRYKDTLGDRGKFQFLTTAINFHMIRDNSCQISSKFHQNRLIMHLSFD